MSQSCHLPHPVTATPSQEALTGHFLELLQQAKLHFFSLQQHPWDGIFKQPTIQPPAFALKRFSDGIDRKDGRCDDSIEREATTDLEGAMV